uniref:Uncharacterized protein n=1 Tax=viral metagenome TaxID=1070528 RepID=A0A6M3JQ80_9ZZZZ
MVEPVSLLAGGIAGGVVGYALKDGSRTPQPVTWDEVIRRIESTKPQLIDVISLDATTARTNVVQEAVGDFILVEHYPSSVPFYIRLNDTNSEQYDLSKLQTISGPFVRFYISNVVGNGEVKLYVCRGVKLTPKLFGIEELANRIIYDVPMSYDGKGEIIFADGYEDGLIHSDTTATGVGVTAAIDTTRARNGLKSVKLDNSSTATGIAEVHHRIPILGANRVGYEISWMSTDSNFHFIHALEYFNGTDAHVGLIGFRASTKKLYYQDSGGSWVELDTITVSFTDYLFHSIKLVIDLNTDKYVKLLFDNHAYDLSGKALYVATDSTNAQLKATSGFPGNNSSSGQTVFVDDAIGTKNEP